jgi:hypothetical protein
MFMRSRRFAGRGLAASLGLSLALTLLAFQAAPVGAATHTTFGAALTNMTQPGNAENGQTCHQNAPVPAGAVCTWVSVTAFENGSHYTAPMTGTINRLRLVTCVAGSFTLQFARVNASRQARIVRSGPVIHYKADPQQASNNCGGNNGDQYVVQTFKISVHVNKGDYIAVKAATLGTLSCSGGSSPLLFYPALPIGGSYRTRTNSASCDLLVQLQYA